MAVGLKWPAAFLIQNRKHRKKWRRIAEFLSIINIIVGYKKYKFWYYFRGVRRRQPLKQRWEKVADYLKAQGMDAAFIHTTHNVFYLTHFYCEPHERIFGLFVFASSDPFMVLPQMEEQRAREAGWTGDVLTYDDATNPWDLVKKEWEKRVPLHKDLTICVEKDHLSLAWFERLSHFLPNAKWMDMGVALTQWRMIKEDDEIRNIKEAARLADEAVKIGIEALKVGCTELEIVATIEMEMKKQGVQDMAFSTMVLFGEKSALPHGISGTRRLKKGDFVLFDLGVLYSGYCSDITRTVVFGTPTEQQREIYEIVRQAQEAAVNASKPGVRLGELDKVARRFIQDKGYGDYFTHRLGHGLGLEPHEAPSVHEANEEVLRENMVFTIEPGIYVPEVGGVRIEDDVWVTKEGSQCLTQFTKEFLVIG